MTIDKKIQHLYGGLNMDTGLRQSWQVQGGKLRRLNSIPCTTWEAAGQSHWVSARQALEMPTWLRAGDRKKTWATDDLACLTKPHDHMSL